MWLVDIIIGIGILLLLSLFIVFICGIVWGVYLCVTGQSHRLHSMRLLEKYKNKDEDKKKTKETKKEDKNVSKRYCATCGNPLSDKEIKDKEDRCWNCKLEDDALIVMGSEEGWA